MQSIVLAGGFGTRLQKIVSDVPKPLAPVGGRPFLQYVVDQLIQYNSNRFIFSLHHKADQIEDFIRRNYPHLSSVFITEPQPLGTGGALKLAAASASETNLVVVNGDTYANVNLNAMLQFHIQKNADCTIAVKEMKDFNRYGVVDFDNNNNIVSFEEKKPVSKGFINVGYLIIKRNIFDGFEHDIFNFETGFLIPNISRLKLAAFPFENTFIDIGVEEDYILAQQLFTNHT